MKVTGSGAHISECGFYRYTLTRKWGPSDDTCVFIMLNPSTADAEKDDPTIRRCMGFAERVHCDNLLVVNLFAYRATSPEDLKRVKDPVGPENNDIIMDILDPLFENYGKIRRVIAAWGNHGTLHNRYTEVVAMFDYLGTKVEVLGLTKTAQPKHPLYIPLDAPLIRMDWTL